MQKWKRHTIYWFVIYLLWANLKSGGNIGLVDLIVNLFFVLIFMMVYYLLTEVQIPRLYNQGKTAWFVVSLLGSSLGFILFWMAGMFFLDELLGDGFKKPMMSIGGYMLETVQFYSPTVALLAWESYAAQKKEQERIEELEKEKITNELKYLKAQLNPHFLFNTLHNLHARVIEKSAEAPDMILRLSGILDYVLYKSQKKAVPLKEEITAIENFLQLEKIRCDGLLEIDLKKQEYYISHVAPLVLLSLVESIFKEVPFLEMDKPKLLIEVKEENGNIDCELVYTNLEKQQDHSSETTFTNIQRRLNLSYPEQHEFVLEEEKGMMKIHLVLQERIIEEGNNILHEKPAT